MNTSLNSILTKFRVIVTLLILPLALSAQQGSMSDRVHFGGAVGAAFGSGYTNVMIAPGVLYDVNDYFSAGVGVQGSYIYYRDRYEAYIYGGSLIGLVNPIPQIQLSAELEQLRVNQNFEGNYYFNRYPESRDFWNTALFFGVGYRTPHVTAGIRYNVLYNEDDLVYSTAWMPFVRVYF